MVFKNNNGKISKLTVTSTMMDLLNIVNSTNVLLTLKTISDLLTVLMPLLLLVNVHTETID